MAPDPTRCGLDHVAPSKISARPPLSVATQNVGPTHDIPTSMFSADGPGATSIMWGRVHEAPFQLTTLPPLSPATQNCGLGHDTESNCPDWSWLPGFDHDDPFHWATPPPSVAMQNVGVAHDSAFGPPQAPDALDQPRPLYVKALPSPSTVTQKVALVHDNACRWTAPATGTLWPHIGPYAVPRPVTVWFPLGMAIQKAALTHDTNVSPAEGGVALPNDFPVAHRPAMNV